MGPFSVSDRHNFPRLSDELVPGVATVVEDVIVGCEDVVGQPVVAEELPDVFDWLNACVQVRASVTAG